MDTNISYILEQLNYLEDAFYDGIDSKLLNHPDLCNFAIQMNTIINNIKKETKIHIKEITKEITKKINNGNNNKNNKENLENSDNQDNRDNLDNINYAQLELLGRNNNIKN
jgi:hypothetical protein